MNAQHGNRSYCCGCSGKEIYLPTAKIATSFRNFLTPCVPVRHGTVRALLFQEPPREFCLQNSVNFASFTRLEPEDAPVCTFLFGLKPLFILYQILKVHKVSDKQSRQVHSDLKCLCNFSKKNQEILLKRLQEYHNS